MTLHVFLYSNLLYYLPLHIAIHMYIVTLHSSRVGSKRLFTQWFSSPIYIDEHEDCATCAQLEWHTNLVLERYPDRNRKACQDLHLPRPYQLGGSILFILLELEGIRNRDAYCILHIAYSRHAPDLGGGGDTLKIKYNHYPNPSIHPSINQIRWDCKRDS